MSETECTRTRSAVTAAAVEGAALPDVEAQHLGSCARCRAFAAGVALAPRVVAGGPKVSPELRRRTLARAGAPAPRLVLLAAAAAALVNLVGSVVLPTVLVARWLALLLPEPAALIGGLGFSLSLGLAGAVLLLVTVVDHAGLSPVLEVSP